MAVEDAGARLNNEVLAGQLAGKFPPAPLTIAELCRRSWANAEAKGFHALKDSDYAFAARTMHVARHLAEAVEHYRHRDVPGMLGSLALVHGEAESLTRIWGMPGVAGDSFRGRMMLVITEIAEAVQGYENGDTTNVAEELADILIRVADTAKQEGIDLEAAVCAKLAANEQRPQMHGKTC